MKEEFCWIRKIEMVLHLLLYLTVSSNQAFAVRGKILNKDNACHRCMMFRDDVQSRYKELTSSMLLLRNGPPADLNDIVLRYIMPGTEFSTAEIFLKDSGFDVYQRPGLETQGRYVDRYDVYAISKNLVEPEALGFSVDVVITLRPASPTDYTLINSVHSYVRITDF